MIAGQLVEGIGSIDDYGASCRDGEGIGLDVADRSVRIFRVEIGYEAGSDAVAKQAKTRRSLPEREKRTSQPLRPRPGNQTVVFGCRPGAMRGGVIKPDFYASSASNVGIIEISGGRILRLEQAPTHSSAKRRMHRGVGHGTRGTRSGDSKPGSEGIPFLDCGCFHRRRLFVVVIGKDMLRNTEVDQQGGYAQDRKNPENPSL